MTSEERHWVTEREPLGRLPASPGFLLGSQGWSPEHGLGARRQPPRCAHPLARDTARAMNRPHQLPLCTSRARSRASLTARWVCVSCPPALAAQTAGSLAPQSVNGMQAGGPALAPHGWRSGRVSALGCTAGRFPQKAPAIQPGGQGSRAALGTPTQLLLPHSPAPERPQSASRRCPLHWAPGHLWGHPWTQSSVPVGAQGRAEKICGKESDSLCSASQGT